MSSAKRNRYERILWMNNWVSTTMIVVGGICAVPIGYITAFVPSATAILVGTLRFFVKPKMGKFFVPVGAYVGLAEIIAATVLSWTGAIYYAYTAAQILNLTGWSMLVVSLLRMLLVNLVTMSPKHQAAVTASQTAAPAAVSGASNQIVSDEI